MAGHSHFHNIKHKKGRADAARSRLFSRLSKIITICAREHGEDVIANSQLRLAIEKAKVANMPKDNIERAIKKGTGGLGANSEKIETITFEILGPEGTGFIVETITDNKNRTTSQIKTITNKNGFKLAGEGSAKWMFSQNGIIEIEDISNDKKEEIELIIIESGAEDFIWYKNEENLNNNNVSIYTKIEDLEKVKNKIEPIITTLALKIKDSKIGWKAKELIEIKKEENVKKITKFLEELNENDDVQEIYFNFI